jgi:hypothetical protein
VDHVVGCRDGSPARFVVPDQGYFALHKPWMADQTKRNALKRHKDNKQYLALLSSVAEVMPQYSLDVAFHEPLRPEMLPQFQSWRTQQSSGTKSD